MNLNISAPMSKIDICYQVKQIIFYANLSSIRRLQKPKILLALGLPVRQSSMYM